MSVPVYSKTELNAVVKMLLLKGRHNKLNSMKSKCRLLLVNTQIPLNMYAGADWDKISGRETSHSSRPYTHNKVRNTDNPICMAIT